MEEETKVVKATDKAVPPEHVVVQDMARERNDPRQDPVNCKMKNGNGLEEEIPPKYNKRDYGTLNSSFVHEQGSINQPPDAMTERLRRHNYAYGLEAQQRNRRLVTERAVGFKSVGMLRTIHEDEEAEMLSEGFIRCGY